MAQSSDNQGRGNVLWIKGRFQSNPTFIPGLEKRGINLELVSNGREAEERIQEESFDILVVDAASMRTSGLGICRNLSSIKPHMPLILISAEDQDVSRKHEFVSVNLQLPFTIRKLANRIKPFLPYQSNNILTAGSIKLDVDRKQVTANNETHPLTPRLTRLLEIFINQKGQVVEREHLFRTVWRTDYIGDTRTLDVHISWLRQAIEVDPKNPKLLITIRGKGYKLEV